MPPAKSESQRRFMNLCLRSPEKAKSKCPSKTVAKEFAQSPKGKKLPKKKSRSIYS